MEGHWKGDTVVGKWAGKESVVLSLLEKKRENYLAFRISGRNSEAVMACMRVLRKEYGDDFSQIFRAIFRNSNKEKKEVK